MKLAVEPFGRSWFLVNVAEELVGSTFRNTETTAGVRYEVLSLACCNHSKWQTTPSKTSVNSSNAITSWQSKSNLMSAKVRMWRLRFVPENHAAKLPQLPYHAMFESFCELSHQHSAKTLIQPVGFLKCETTEDMLTYPCTLVASVCPLSSQKTFVTTSFFHSLQHSTWKVLNIFLNITVCSAKKYADHIPPKRHLFTLPSKSARSAFWLQFPQLQFNPFLDSPLMYNRLNMTKRGKDIRGAETGWKRQQQTHLSRDLNADPRGVGLSFPVF